MSEQHQCFAALETFHRAFEALEKSVLINAAKIRVFMDTQLHKTLEGKRVLMLLGRASLRDECSLELTLRFDGDENV